MDSLLDFDLLACLPAERYPSRHLHQPALLSILLHPSSYLSIQPPLFSSLSLLAPSTTDVPSVELWFSCINDAYTLSSNTVHLPSSRFSIRVGLESTSGQLNHKHAASQQSHCGLLCFTDDRTPIGDLYLPSKQDPGIFSSRISHCHRLDLCGAGSNPFLIDRSNPGLQTSSAIPVFSTASTLLPSLGPSKLEFTSFRLRVPSPTRNIRTRRVCRRP